jgi:hypothetical protein
MNTIILTTEEEKELWRAVAVAIASSSNTSDKSTMKCWADKAVEYYRERTSNE